MSISEKTCSYCSRTARSGYVRYDDGTICCAECKEHYPACSRCAKPARQHVSQDGQTVCIECAKTLRRCAICGKFILEKAYKFGETRYCPPCYEQAEKCSSCGIPMPPSPPEETGPKICGSCRERLPKCSFCGKPIFLQAYKNESQNILACADCYPKVDRCIKCGVPLKNPRPYQGRTYCSRCSPVPVKSSPVKEKQQTESPLPEISGEKQYTFLVVNPTNAFELRQEKETLLVHNCFKNYHEYVKQIISENRGILVSSEKERILCLFEAAEDAIRGAEALMDGMATFNRRFNKISVPLTIRIGLNSIEKSVTTAQGKTTIESLYGSVTDLAYRVEEMAEPGMVLIAEQTYNHLGRSRPRFVKHKKYNDLHLSMMTYKLQ